jgi:hypothetical protein
MSKAQLHHLLNDLLLILGFSSAGLFAVLQNISEWCKVILPITGVFSFMIYVIVNWGKIKETLFGNGK